MKQHSFIVEKIGDVLIVNIKMGCRKLPIFAEVCYIQQLNPFEISKCDPQQCS